MNPLLDDYSDIKDMVKDLDLSSIKKSEKDYFARKLQKVVEQLKDKGMSEDKIKKFIDFMMDQHDTGNIFYM